MVCVCSGAIDYRGTRLKFFYDVECMSTFSES